ncbi:hypothetical protein OSTOST_21732 [Ostertagia ostertagi]
MAAPFGSSPTMDDSHFGRGDSKPTALTDLHPAGNNEESSFDEFNGDGESSQHTDVVGIPSDDDCAGSRPLLEDDALDDDEEEVVGVALPPQQPQNVSKSLFVDPDLVPFPSRKSTNPFLVSTSDDTPKISPVLPSAVQQLKWHESEQTAVIGFCEPNIALNMTVQQPPVLACGFAPATLPRQSTPLTAAPRFAVKPTVALESPSIPCISQPPPVAPIRPTQPAQHPVLQQSSVTKQVVLQTLPSNDSSVPSVVERNPPSSVPQVPQVRSLFTDKQDSHSSPVVKCATPSFIEGPKTPKPKKSKEKKRRTSMSKKKKRSFPLLGSNPSVAPLDLKLSGASSAALLKKSSAKKEQRYFGHPKRERGVL